jgi:PIN domain nuclease of toxin-antitoxin system
VILVDTHVWLWFHGDPTRLGRAARERLQDPGTPLVVSAASAWEIAVKVGIGKLRLGQPLLSWWQTRLASARATELAVSAAHAAALEGLPPVHRDPFDRLLVAQANLEGLTLMTGDDVVLRYPGVFFDARS